MWRRRQPNGPEARFWVREARPHHDEVGADDARDSVLFSVDERVGTIRGDERKVKQVLLNLLSNALKLPEGGRIDVRAAVHEGLVEVSVADTGVGIAPEDQEAVFEEFRQVGTSDKKVEGTGLGLALSRKFIELHGGRIWVSRASWATARRSRSRCRCAVADEPCPLQ